MADFRFKKFVIRQDNCAMKVNTDGVLLAAWMELHPLDRYMLEIGTGSGVMAIMAAQRLVETGVPMPGLQTAEIDAVEIDNFAAMDAEYNFKRVEWLGERVKLNLINMSFEAYASKCGRKYDLIFSNPPYFSNSLKNPDHRKSLARHNDTLTQSVIIRNVANLLAPGGRLAMILPVDEAADFKRKTAFLYDAAKEGERVLVQIREALVKTNSNKAAKRALLEFGYLDKTSSLSGIVEKSVVPIMEEGKYSDAYRELTKAFYINF